MTGIAALLEPSSIVVVGASADPDRVSGRTLKYLRNHGFAGPVYGVNPKYDTDQGWPCLPAIAALPEQADLAVLSVKAASLAASLTECAKAGIRSAVVFSSVPADLADEVNTCIRHLTSGGGFRVLGPNCNGLINLEHHVTVGFSPAIFSRRSYRTGWTALIAQSGGVMASAFCRGQAGGLGIRYAIGMGNEVDLTLEELVADAAVDPTVTTIACFAETFRNPAGLKMAAARAGKAGKPVILLKGGRSLRGRVAAASHTGAMVGDANHERAFLDALGIIQVDDIDQMWEQALLAERYGPTRVARVGILTASGGSEVLAADLCADYGLTIPDISPSRQQRILARAAMAAPANPVDVTGQIGESTDAWVEALEVLIDEAEVDAVVAIVSESGRDREVAAVTGEMAGRTSKPVIVSWVSDTSGAETGYSLLLDSDVPVFGGLLPAIRALSRSAQGDAGSIGRPPWLDAKFDAVPGAEPRRLDEGRARLRVEQQGFPQARAALVDWLPGLRHVLEQEIAVPVMLKLNHPDLAHCARVGGVKGPLHSWDDIDRTAAELMDLADGLGLDGAQLLVAEYVEHLRPELFLGVRNDFASGPLVVVGMGGVAVEETGDARGIPAPCSPGQAHALLSAIDRRSAVLASGGEAAVEAVTRAIVKLSDIAWETRLELQELDLNPVILSNRGQVLALDAFAVLRPAS